MASIFVNICSYRDPLLIYTLRNMMEMESGNNNVIYGIFEQRQQSGSLQARSSELATHDRVRYKRIDPEFTDGVGWARHINSLQYRNEDLYYQIDSHMLFDKDWDQQLVDDYELAAKTYNTDKIIITASCKTVKLDASGIPYKLEPESENVTCETKFHGAFWDGTPMHCGLIIPAKDNCAEAYMIWAGNVLFPRRYVNDIGFDPNTGFRGEQCHMTLQAFSNGYKLVHPRRIVAYHYNESGDFWTKPYHKPVVSEKKLAEMKEHDETHFQQYLKNLSPEVIEEYRRITGFDYIQKTIEKRSYTSKIGCNYPFKVIDDRI